jgi:hypothetical protein
MPQTIRWLDRCIAAHQRPHDQNLFGIVQGGLDPVLRDWCLDEMLKRDAHLPGYAIGGTRWCLVSVFLVFSVSGFFPFQFALCMCVFMCVRMYVCMNVCMYVCMYVCIYVCVCT